jgi:hypothetical protein
MKGAAMEHSIRFKGQLWWVLGLLVIGAALMLFACDQPSGQSDLSKKAPPSLGAIADVDGSDDTKKEGKKPQTGAEQAPAQSAAGSQPVQAAPKQ